VAVSDATKLSDFSGFLTPEMASPIFEEAAKVSVVQQLVQRVPLGPSGVSIPVVTGRMSAGWVDEAGQKPASEGSMSLKSISPKKLAAIAVVSAEVVRANPGGYVDLIRPQIAEAFALAFDAAALHGTSTPFSQYLDQTSKAAEIGAHTGSEGGVWQDLVTALDLLVSDGKKLTGWALDDVVEPNLLGSVDGNGRPIFADLGNDQRENTVSQAARPGRLMGRTSWMSDTVATTDKTTVVGYGGNWRQAAWGAVGGITYDISTQATVTVGGELVSLWENNLVAIRAEAEYGWLVNDVASFVRLTNATGS
jgi:HK97 family phage major capsid protein